jgi:hypothetical protein
MSLSFLKMTFKHSYHRVSTRSFAPITGSAPLLCMCVPYVLLHSGFSCWSDWLCHRRLVLWRMLCPYRSFIGECLTSIGFSSAWFPVDVALAFSLADALLPRVCWPLDLWMLCRWGCFDLWRMLCHHGYVSSISNPCVDDYSSHRHNLAGF